MKNCLWSRNWKQSVQQFKGAEPMKVSVNYYLRSAMLVSVVCWLGHLMELRWEKGLYPHGSSAEVFQIQTEKFQNTEGTKAATDAPGRWASMSENCWLISEKSRFWPKSGSAWCSLPLVIPHCHCSQCWLLMQSGEERRVACNVREFVWGQMFMGYRSM